MIGPNELYRMAQQQPDECILKGSGVVKLLDAIRELEAQLREARALRDCHLSGQMSAAQAVGHFSTGACPEADDPPSVQFGVMSVEPRS